MRCKCLCLKFKFSDTFFVPRVKEGPLPDPSFTLLSVQYNAGCRDFFNLTPELHRTYFIAKVVKYLKIHRHLQKKR